MGHDSFHLRDMTQPDVCYDAFTCVTHVHQLRPIRDVHHAVSCRVGKRKKIRDMTHLIHDVCIDLFHPNFDMTHSHA